MTLTEYKAAHGLKLVEMAARLGLPVSTLNGYLLGRRRPDAEQLARLSAATGGVVTPAEMRPDLAVLMRPQPQAAA